MTIKKGVNWGGSYSRFSFETTGAELKRYLGILKEKSKPVLDDEFNFLQDALLTMIRRSVHDLAGDGSPNDGFKIVGDSSNNDFVVTGGDDSVDGAGVFYVRGLRVIIPANVTYTTQESPGPALTPPVSGTRLDTVYLDVYIDEIGPAADASIVDPTLAVETSRRAKLKYLVRVAEGGSTPADYTDAEGMLHFTAALATITRTSSAQITAAMVKDLRQEVLDSEGVIAAIRARDPAGTVKAYAGAAAPDGFLLCDGSPVLRSAYPDLFSAIGVVFGPGDGVTTFNLPDLRGRTPIGAGAGTGLTNRALGAKVGAETHVLTIAEMPSHTHGLSGGAGGGGHPTLNDGDGNSGLTDATGGGGAHNNMQPSLALNFIIAF